MSEVWIGLLITIGVSALAAFAFSLGFVAGIRRSWPTEDATPPRPGRTVLVLEYDHALTPEQGAAIGQGLEAALASGAPIVLEEGAHLRTITVPDDAPIAWMGTTDTDERVVRGWA